jgi:hypothetical protein
MTTFQNGGILAEVKFSMFVIFGTLLRVRRNIQLKEFLLIFFQNGFISVLVGKQELLFVKIMIEVLN